ncbi:MAG: hypothetical protein EZS28_024270 [Streblomastix strix]|uniref:Uncharacterized protein n=1 Tax=Streblomastix strix TaxID=222440 RepID=A0A5J4VCM8_9EUKA|nr:MAG: hypothetical protein EZS28_024270 [Streblomastix strix]
MDERDSPNPIKLSQDGPGKELRAQSSSNNEEIPAVLPDLTKKKEYEVQVGEQNGEVQMLFSRLVKAIVMEQRLFGIRISERARYIGLGFQITGRIEITSDKICTFRVTEPDLPILTESQQIQQMKRKREENARIDQAINPLLVQFQQLRLKYAKFNSILDQKVAQDLTSTFGRILKQEAGKLDVLRYQIQPISRQKLFEEIAWSGANLIFPNPEEFTNNSKDRIDDTIEYLKNNTAKADHHKVPQIDELYQVSFKREMFRHCSVYVSDKNNSKIISAAIVGILQKNIDPNAP